MRFFIFETSIRILFLSVNKNLLMNEKAAYYISKLKLMPHPEGGYFNEVYRSEEKLSKENLPARYNGKRSVSTSIYFLLEGEQVSAFHRLKSDETWHFYDGSVVKIYILANDGQMSEILLGKNLEDMEFHQVTIKKNSWFGAEVLDKGSFAFLGCTVAPGFDYDDLEFGNRKLLLSLYPHQENIIRKLTKIID